MTSSNSSKAGTHAGGAPPPPPPPPECCMCGDYGISYELFQCKVCQFRSQHRYCSNLYPKAESYRVCNWCLNPKDEAQEKTQNSSNSSSSNRNNEESDDSRLKKKKSAGGESHGPGKVVRGSMQQPVNGPIKKQKSPERSPASTRKRIITTGCMEERLRRTSSEGSGITKHVFRNKVRRYKLLDEVSS